MCVWCLVHLYPKVLFQTSFTEANIFESYAWDVRGNVHSYWWEVAITTVRI